MRTSSTICSFIAAKLLKADWYKMSDLDRAGAVSDLSKAWIPICRLARLLGFSESLSRHLLNALLTPPEDRTMAQEAWMSTNDLVHASDRHTS